ncbi:MAG: MFS transporter [Gammaproteobacteria bacterium]|nr:MFS transporter [Gammaproteobacteria bacterium]
MPYWRLSSYYFFYFASLGALLPYWSLYLKSLEFSAQQIGVLMAVVMATKIISPNIWGWIADRSGRRMAIVRMGSLLSILAFAGVFLAQEYLWLMAVMLLFSFFWNATLPQFEVTTFDHLGEAHHRYSSIRLWGSVGFILAVAGLGWLLQELGVGLLPAVLLTLFGLIWGASLLVPEKSAGHLVLDHEPLWQVLKRPEVFSLLAACFLMQAGHGAYYTFYSLYMEDHGYGRALIGQLWALGVVAEVGLFLVMHRLVPRFGLVPLLKLSFLIAALRWGLIAAFPEQLWLMLLTQLMHAATFGIYHAASIALIQKYFPGQHKGKGQALYSSFSFGAGGALGALYSGYAWDQLGGSFSFMMATLLSLIGWWVLQWAHSHSARVDQS